MAENIYSKGTRVWFEDKDHAWISAEVLSITKAADDTVKILFVDERGKVLSFTSLNYLHELNFYPGNYREYYCQGYQGWCQYPTPLEESSAAGNGGRSGYSLSSQRTFRYSVFFLVFSLK